MEVLFKGKWVQKSRGEMNSGEKDGGRVVDGALLWVQRAGVVPVLRLLLFALLTTVSFRLLFYPYG